MNDSAAAAVFFSHATLVAVWLVWVLLFRPLRAGFLRLRLRSLPLATPAAERTISRAVAAAPHLTLTRVLLCAAYAKGSERPDGAGGDHARILLLILRQATGGLPLPLAWLGDPARTLELLLASCESRR